MGEWVIGLDGRVDDGGGSMDACKGRSRAAVMNEIRTHNKGHSSMYSTELPCDCPSRVMIKKQLIKNKHTKKSNNNKNPV